MSSRARVLKRLCNYYLSCLAHDDSGGVSVPAVPYGSTNHFEIEGLEPGMERLPKWREGLAEFVHGRFVRDASTLKLGYPVFVTGPRGSGRDDRKLMPLFLFEVSLTQDGLYPEWRSCCLNLEAVRELEGNGGPYGQHALMELESNLGLSNNQALEFSHVMETLKLLRPEWPWGDNNGQLPKEVSLANPECQNSIYDRSLILQVDRPYTMGLEAELKKLAEVTEESLTGTALGALLNGLQAGAVGKALVGPPLEVLPMNAEQRIALQMAFEAPLATVTGPPGSGKSQLIANLLANSAYAGRSVLFTSKNNKAVEVVESRVNALGTYPVMVRLGAKEHRSKLAEHLSRLLSSVVPPEEIQALRDVQTEYVRLCKALDAIEEDERTLIEARNQLDRLDQEMDELRERIGTEPLNLLKGFNLSKARQALLVANDAFLNADQDLQPTFTRLLWPIFKRARLESMDESARALLNQLGASKKPLDGTAVPESEDLEDWRQFFVSCLKTVAVLEQIASFQKGLQGLRELDLPALAQRRLDIQKELVQVSARLWKRWVVAQPALLGADQRRTLANYSAVLSTVLSSGSEDHLPDEVRKEYERLTLDAPELISCFAVTSLSVRNRVPFKPGVFDLVVFDESSQCDIASALPILYRAKRAVVIGDPRQLTHIASLRRDRDMTYMVDSALHETHLAWQYSSQSLFALTASRIPDRYKISLLEHHRSHQDIIGFSNRQFYDERLRIVTRLPALKRATPKGPAVRWLDIKGKAKRGNMGSVFNHEECEAIVKEIKRLLQAGYTGSIGVVTPFAYQADRIRRELERDRKLYAKLHSHHDFQSNTAHGFQGDERDLMIFSVVATESLSQGALRFLEHEGNVFNVAITRARAELVVVGDLNYCLQTPIAHLKAFAQYTQEILDLPEIPVRPPVPAREYPDDPLRGPRPWEKKLYQALFDRGIHALPGFSLEQYTIDLAILKDGLKLAIDIDDEDYHREWTGETCEREQLRAQRLLELGWSVHRIWVYQIKQDLNWCLDEVVKWLGEDPPPAGDKRT